MKFIIHNSGYEIPFKSHSVILKIFARGPVTKVSGIGQNKWAVGITGKLERVPCACILIQQSVF